MKKALTRFCLITMAIAIIIGYPGMYMLGKSRSDSSLINKIAAVTEEATALRKKFKDQVASSATTLAKLAEQEELLKEYEEKEAAHAVVEDIREIQATLFREVKASIEYSEQVPYSIGSGKMINPDLIKSIIPESSGYFVDRTMSYEVTYYYGVLTNRIDLKSSAGRIDINYSADSFIIPYTVDGKESELNTWAHILTDSGDTKDITIINTVRSQQLSLLEDEYLKSLKEKYSSSKITVYVNGVKLSDFTADDKKFGEIQTDLDYEVTITK